MKILFTNLNFDGYSGTIVVTRDLAKALHQRGHYVSIYSRRLGPPAEEVRSSGVTITDDLSSLPEDQDIIHGHHHAPVMETLLRFPLTPAIYLCHDATYRADEPPAFPRIRRYLAVDERCRERIRQTLGEGAGEVEMIPNAVDTGRFLPRPALPPRPVRALVFSNYAHGGTHLPAIRKACRKAGIHLDVLGSSAGSETAHPESILQEYDLVFAKARCALEAMATGNAVVLCDFAGLGPYVRAADFDAMRPKNFGRALLTGPLTPAAVLEQIARYDAADAAALCARVRNEASLNGIVERWESIYRQVLENFDPTQVDHAEESRATSVYLSRWHYDRRREWEIAQLLRLKKVPFVGEELYAGVRRALRRWRSYDANW